MKQKNKRLYAVLLSMVFPGAGHLYAERYVAGTVGVILTTWAVLCLILSVLIFNISEGIGMWIFPISLYSGIGLWISMTVSSLLKDIRIFKEKINREEVYGSAYSLFLKKSYEESLKEFRKLMKDDPYDMSSGVMTATLRYRMGMGRKALSILKQIKRKTDDSLWIWEIDRLSDRIRQTPQPEPDPDVSQKSTA